MAERPAWALVNGLPSLHVARAALRAAAIIDRRGSVVADADESHWHQASGGIYPPDDLMRGRALLVDVGLLHERDGSLWLTPLLEELLAESVDNGLAAVAEAALAWGLDRKTLGVLGGFDGPMGAVEDDLAALVPDPARREAILVALGRRFDDSRRRLVGEIGEEMVVAAARDELMALGHDELAREVRRVSLLSDELGYDVRAPRIESSARLLEVKTTTNVVDDVFGFYLSRGEIEVGRQYPDWALVACVIDDVGLRRGQVLGWCRAGALEDLVPVDGHTGRWETARIELPLERLSPGLPGPAG